MIFQKTGPAAPLGSQGAYKTIFVVAERHGMVPEIAKKKHPVENLNHQDFPSDSTPGTSINLRGKGTIEEKD